MLTHARTGHSSWELGEGADGFTGRVVDGARSSHANDGEMDDFEALGKAHEVEERV